jgi:hypothetical protein
MWYRLPDNIIQERTAILQKKKGIPKTIRAILATAVFAAVLYGISFLNEVLQRNTGKNNPGQSFSLQNASVPALIAIFLATAIFMYFLLVKNRKAPIIFICYDCQEPFHAQAACPACGSSNVSDIRFAEWVEK